MATIDEIVDALKGIGGRLDQIESRLDRIEGYADEFAEAFPSHRSSQMWRDSAPKPKKIVGDLPDDVPDDVLENLEILYSLWLTHPERCEQLKDPDKQFVHQNLGHLAVDFYQVIEKLHERGLTQ